MSSYSGPKITTNGLLVSYDAANNKSFRGQATTNIISNGEFASGLNNWNPYALPLASLSVITSSDVPQYLNEDKTLLNCLCLTTAHGGGNYGGAYQFLPTQTVGVTYTISYYARCLVDTMGLKFSFQGGTGDENNLSHSRTITTEWKKYSHTATLNISKGIVFIANQNRSGGTFQITDIQLEASPYASSFVNGTRGTTLATGGGLADLSGNDYNAELLNGIGESSDNLGGLIFDGSNDYISTQNYDLDFGTQSFSLCALVNSNNISYSQKIINKGQSASFPSRSVGYSLRFISSVARFSVWDGTNLVDVSSSTLQSNTWYHIVGVCNRTTGTCDLYINGLLINSANIQSLGSISIPEAELTIGNLERGSYGTDGEFFNGKISNVQIYDKILTSQEVQQNFNSIRGRFGI